jgi:hypothetical protein
VLGLAHQLGHALMGGTIAKISLLDRLVQHGLTTAEYNIYYGEGSRCLRRARPHGAGGDLQFQGRPVSLSELAAGVFALEHVDARLAWACWDLPSNWSFSAIDSVPMVNPAGR